MLEQKVLREADAVVTVSEKFAECLGSLEMDDYDFAPQKLKNMIPHINFRNLKFIPHAQVTMECVNSEVLLLVINKSNHNEGILTYKLYEYIGSRTLICIYDEDGNLIECYTVVGHGHHSGIWFNIVEKNKL